MIDVALLWPSDGEKGKGMATSEDRAEVYILIRDGETLAVFSTKESADAFVAAAPYELDVERFDLDPAIADWRLMEVSMDREGRVFGPPKGYFLPPSEQGNPVEIWLEYVTEIVSPSGTGWTQTMLRHHSHLENEDDAKEEANEVRKQLIDEGLWPDGIPDGTLLVELNEAIRRRFR